MRLIVALAAALILSGCVTAPPQSAWRAPVPTRPLDAERLWSGRWLEIARTPMSLTDGCVAGASNYRLTSPTRVEVRDTCQDGTPTGREKAIGGRGEILDPGVNARLRVRYFWGFVTWDYWVVDRAEDYSWFIAVNPTLDKAFIYTRRVPGLAQRDELVRRLAATGYDVTKLEFPETAPE